MENTNNQNPIPQQNDLPPMVENPQAPVIDVPGTPVAPEIPKSKSKLMPILLIILILVLLGVGGIYAYKNFFVKTPEPTPTPISTPESTTDPTADWKTYKDPILGVEYKLPPKLIQAKTSGMEVAGETGTQYCSTYEGSLSVFIKTVHAGGGPCGGGIFTIGTVSKDYSAGREGGFGDYTGYVEVNGKYHAIFVNTIGSGYIPTNLVKEITNDHGFTYLKIVGENSPQDYGGELRNVETPGTPGEGYLGALVNIQDNVKYSGFNIQMKINSEADIQIFDQILSTFKFMETTPTPIPSGSTTNYTAPSTWSQTTILGELKLCLPPKWENESGFGALFYNRDSSYRPQFTTIENIPYKDGSRREAYFNFWENESPNVRELVSVKDVNINGNSILV